ncbi:MAG: hypothetical protein M4579_002939 [Chaenotheca gracillima]|nr:MAG: hypothetical protein M4579_002939 [Chaenotheca gracillima]
MEKSSVTGQQAFRCTFKGCPATFRTKSLVKKHKAANPEHDYCKTCDEDFANEQALVIHKIQSEKHIICPACAEEFKSHGGCKLHIEQMHGAKQHIACAGCGDIFARAGSLMAHIEQNACNKIRPAEFMARRARREVLGRFLADPEAFQEKLDRTAKSEAAQSAATEASTQLTEPSLMDDSDEAPILKEKTLQPQKQTKAGQSEWPDLQTVAYHKGDQDQDLLTGLRSLTTIEPTDTWGGGASSSLFPDAIRNMTFSQGVENLRGLAGNTFGILSHNEAWDPDSKKFRVSSFFREADKKYHCPHPQCSASFSNDKDFTTHLSATTHLPEKVQCPACLKLFRTTSALVQHCESPSTRCRIRYTDDFNIALDNLTGGMLEADGYHDDGSIKLKAVEPDW